ncbi:MAG: paraquat-inducible protein A [Gemmatimonadales bacterium]
MSKRNVVAVVLLVVSFALLVPGLTQPLVTISASMQILGMTTELFRETRSILQSISTLHESGDDFVAGLILLFSVIVPFVKGLLLLTALMVRHSAARWGIKWSMADVFAVGVFVAYLGARAASNLDAEVHEGFFYFTGYCLVSLVSLQFMHFVEPEKKTGD